jgi:hypothetical protein
VRRERALRVVLMLVGLPFSATVYPSVVSLRQSNQAQYEPMVLSLYVTLGIFLLLAARDPSASRTLIGFTAWSSFAHGAVMAVQAPMMRANGGTCWAAWLGWLSSV